MGKEKLSLYLLSLLLIIPIISSATSSGSCTVERDILDIEEDDEFWLYDDDDDFYSDSKLKKEKKITYKYSILCENVILNPELSLQSQITGNHKNESTQATVITLVNCTLPTVSVVFFKDMDVVSKLDMSNNRISSIEPGALNMPNLLTLILSKNNLTEIKEGTFERLSKVSEIDLQSNQISSFESFKNCELLEYLYLRMNNITTIKEEHFQNLKRLLLLDLSNNNISTIHPNSFVSLAQLKYVTLEYNALEAFPETLFKDMGIYTLRIMNFSHNCLKEISFENQFTKVSKISSYFYYILRRELDLSYNNLTSIPRYLSNISRLGKTLYLNNNNIKTIPADDLNGMNYTEFLDLSHNKIDMIEIGAFRQLSALEILDLSSNKLKELKSGVFTGLNNVRQLNLSYNEFIHFDSTSFFTMSSLKEILFAGNYLHSLNTSEFHFQKLAFISLEFHQISCPALTKFIKAFASHGITVRNGSTLLSENIHGIACNDTIKPTTSTTTVPPTTTVSTTVSSTTLPVSTTESTTAIIHEVPATTIVTETNVSEKSQVLEEPHTSKASHTIIIVTIVLLLASATGVAVWFGRKYYYKRINNTEDSDAQYRLVNILEDAEKF